MNLQNHAAPRLVDWAFRQAVGVLVTHILLSLPGGLLRAQPVEIRLTLEQRLLQEEPADLAREARDKGDPGRGAIVFYQPQLNCIKCHTMKPEDTKLAPDLTKGGEEVTDVYLVESLLTPSKVLKQGYEPVIVITDRGKPISGLLIEERGDAIVLRDPAKDERPIVIPLDTVDDQVQGKTSVMPTGLINALTTRQEFLDLLRYLMEITELGPQRAKQLQPPPSLYAVRPLPEYEQEIDHAGMIRDLDGECFDRGKTIYERLCVNCHGTVEEPGSLPTSLRFAEGPFKSGGDPYTMYQTLTRGYGMMIAQAWMVPQQKYDVIHYIREAYVKPHNPGQYREIDASYLAGLPSGTTRGPEPKESAPWSDMDYGPNLIATYEIGEDRTNFAYKGIAVRLDAGPGGISRGKYWMIFDHDTLRVAAGWTGEGFIDWNAILFNGRHGVHPRVVGELYFQNKTGPGWGRPEDGSFEDPRFRGRDDRPYGPLPREWAKYRGLYHYGNQVIVSYTVGKAEVLEMPGVVTSAPQPIFTRTFNLGPRQRDLVLQVADHGEGGLALRGLDATEPARSAVAVYGADMQAEAVDAGLPLRPLIVGVSPPVPGMQWAVDEDGQIRLTLPAGQQPLRYTLWTSRVDSVAAAKALVAGLELDAWTIDLASLTHGGPRWWTDSLTTQAVRGAEDGPFAIDTLTHPEPNPWMCRNRLTGFDFFADDDRAAVCSWDGDVWMVSGILGRDTEDVLYPLTWQRIASGLFQPLGLKIVDEQIFVTCRDQLVILRDLNGDGQTDFYESFNNDHQVTEHFHEFAMGLQRDDDGSFYYAKSARHALTPLVPHHGTLLRISADGSRTDILAKGFRAANGVCINPDGTFFVTDQEGHWMPKNRINWISGEGKFYGNMWGYHDVTDPSDDLMERPLCWITNAFDRSPAELVWVDSDRWGPLKGSLLNFSYGYGKIYVVPHERMGPSMQGGMCQLPIPLFPTGTMRGRFHTADGQLYTCGMFAWAGNQSQPGGFYRVRYTGKPVYLPVGLNATTAGMRITFSGELDPQTAADPKNYAVKIWSLKRTANYGSDHHNEHTLEVTAATLTPDGRTVEIKIPTIQPTWCMEIRYQLKGADGQAFEGSIHNTIHDLGADDAE